MSKPESTSIQPKSIRQKRILETAANNPDASLAEIAEEIPSASADHVDRVLEQYGDPAASGDAQADESPPASPNGTSANDADPDSPDSSDGQPPAEATVQSSDQPSSTDATTDSSSATDTPEISSQMDPDTEPEPTETVVESQSEPADDSAETTRDDTPSDASGDEALPDTEDLTQKERETLRAIYYEPTATQDQIADMLSISRATVSNRVNAIPGFDWADRDTFVDAVFDEDLTVDSAATPANGKSDPTDQNAGKEAVTDGAPSANADPPAGDSTSPVGQDATFDGVVDGSTPTAVDSAAAGQSDTTDDRAADSADDIEALSHQLDQFAQQLATMEAEIRDSGAAAGESLFDDADILHKVVHACMESDRITEAEELEILETLMD